MEHDEEQQNIWQEPGSSKPTVIGDTRVAYIVEPQEDQEELRGTTRLSGKNQITLPVAMVRALGWRAGEEVDLMIDGQEIWLRRRLQGRQLLDRLEGALSHVPEWQTDEGIRTWVRGERDSWDREWDSNETPSKSGSAD
jgi:bifunctional DNA-binding transcriptional regulator/antitoxin component of YhaV-PrlF toxin-antitoxin module